MSSDEVADLNTTLDALCIKSIQTVDAIQQKRAEMVQLIKDGLFNIARTRNSMGGLSVTESQFPAKIYPTTVVTAQQPADDVENSTPDLHMRELEEPLQGSDSDSDDETTYAAKMNPVRWFGVLVPPYLKQAQSEFKKGMLHNTQTQVHASC
eukprot:TRINITY_DN881_c0_g1_i1.p1 TRINITY_DN881_c0_g1~~TRINITY_DN881_c0_g1_i1.p1  ORF type:complete len:152 (+),score=32.41 TRINITY_DN881_c0_g1_i1:21-476(+)